MSDIALLFLTYKNILHRDNSVFTPYLQNTNVYIHPKEKNAIDKPFKEKVIKTQVKTSWGSSSIVIATLLLLKEAYKNNSNQWFILCSEDVFPLKTYDDFISYLRGRQKSLFSTMKRDKFIKDPDIIKTQQWWALKREDVMMLLNGLHLTDLNDYTAESFESHVTNERLFKTIISKIPKNAALDEYFFLSALKMSDPSYDYSNKMICYTKWFNWISKHPTIFNTLLPSDEIDIKNNDSCFIRKTFPTFKNEVIKPKDACIVVIVGSENINKNQHFDTILTKYQPTHDIFLLCMVDDLSPLNSGIKQACCQCFFVVWKMVDQACEELGNMWLKTINNTKVYKSMYKIPESAEFTNTTNINQYLYTTDDRKTDSSSQYDNRYSDRRYDNSTRRYDDRRYDSNKRDDNRIDYRKYDSTKRDDKSSYSKRWGGKSNRRKKPRKSRRRKTRKLRKTRK